MHRHLFRGRNPKPQTLKPKPSSLNLEKGGSSVESRLPSLGLLRQAQGSNYGLFCGVFCGVCADLGLRDQRVCEKRRHNLIRARCMHVKRVALEWGILHRV